MVVARFFIIYKHGSIQLTILHFFETEIRNATLTLYKLHKLSNADDSSFVFLVACYHRYRHLGFGNTLAVKQHSVSNSLHRILWVDHWHIVLLSAKPIICSVGDSRQYIILARQSIQRILKISNRS